MGVGPREAKHFNFYDIDRKDIDLPKIRYGAPDALIIATSRGLHIINATEITDEYILSLKDLKCPSNAVRFYPHDDLILLFPATRLCVKVAKIYESVFNGTRVTEAYLPCNEQLKFGIYMAAKDGIRLTGTDRHLPPKNSIVGDVKVA